MDYRKKKNLIWKGESFLFVVVLLVFGAIFAAIHTGGLIQKQDSVQLLNKGWYYIKDGKKQEITLPAEIPAKKNEKPPVFRLTENRRILSAFVSRFLKIVHEFLIILL